MENKQCKLIFSDCCKGKENLAHSGEDHVVNDNIYNEQNYYGNNQGYIYKGDTNYVYKNSEDCTGYEYGKYMDQNNNNYVYKNSEDCMGYEYGNNQEYIYKGDTNYVYKNSEDCTGYENGNNQGYIYKGDPNYVYKSNEMYTQKNDEIPVINVQGDQPVFNIPVYQDKYIRDKIIETPKYEFQDVVQPKYYRQEANHDVPCVELLFKERNINMPKEKIVENKVEVNVPIGYTPIYSPVWDVREIPRVVPKYEGEQKIIEVEVPQIKYIDKYIEKEIVVDIKEKIIPKVTEIEKQVDIVKYEWKEKYQDVPVCKYVPKIDVELDCPSPLIVPYPEVHFQNTSEIMNPNQKSIDISNEILMNNLSSYNTMQNKHIDESIRKSLLEMGRLPNKMRNQNNDHIRNFNNKFSELNNINMNTKNNKMWPFCTFDNCINNESKINGSDDIDPQTGYPVSMPKNFASFFKKDLNSVKSQMMQFKNQNEKNNEISNNIIENSPVSPTIEYIGKIDKPPVDGGKLDSISFKLHAIEVHQFIPVPNLPKPQFLDLVPPEQFENNDISSLHNIFGKTSEDWVDPHITGYIAPMMNDILHGNIQPQTSLFNKLSIGNSPQQNDAPSINAPSSYSQDEENNDRAVKNTNSSITSEHIYTGNNQIIHETNEVNDNQMDYDNYSRRFSDNYSGN
ncbi:Pfs77 homologue, putative inner membrane complex protein 1j, putative [Plasmodium vinckei]|uniref:Pfs77 homologue, putative inner membrane complex protein 1j, putative n=1 Tax=Plasmodium vinckei TaxID=5860 RepID=A0A6V7T5X6_PLAVN|nr:Pfs77 homologue, putative inner membrane complex protein 1j, putative [Plasmodium vinckei]